jgi:hypothetical protein
MQKFGNILKQSFEKILTSKSRRSWIRRQINRNNNKECIGELLAVDIFSPNFQPNHNLNKMYYLVLIAGLCNQSTLFLLDIYYL